LLLRFRRQLPCIVSCHTRYINYSSQNCPTFNAPSNKASLYGLLLFVRTLSSLDTDQT
jgi:hypothetical protein